MNLLFLSTWFPCPPDNGSKIRAYHMLRALGRRHRVTLVSFAFGSAGVEDPFPTLPFCHDSHVLPRNPFERSGFRQATRYLSLSPVVTRSLPEMERLVGRVMAKTAFDAVVASTAVMATYALAAPQTAVKILEEHNAGSRRAWERYQSQLGFLQRLRCWISWQKLRRYESRLFRRFDLCTMVSQEDRWASERMVPGYEGGIEVVPNGVDCQANRFEMADEPGRRLIYNGALTYDANYDAMQYFLARIYPRIRAQVPEVSLTITGSLNDVDLSGLRLDEGVNLSGYVEDIRPLVAGSSVCVVPLREGGGTRIKILEAMALGTPVVSTTKGAEGLAVEDDRHLLLADDPEVFAARTVELLRNRALRRRLALEARRLVEERYDWQSIGEAFVSLIEEVVAGAERAADD